VVKKSMRKRECAILYVDDEEKSLKYFKRAFAGKFQKIYTATNADDGYDLLQANAKKIAAVMTDQRMPGMDGVTLLEKALKFKPGIPRILVTAYSDIDVATRAITQAKVFGYIEKPWKPKEIAATLDHALDYYLQQKPCWEGEAGANVLPSWIIDLPYPKAKEKLRELYVNQMLARFDGNISKTARETTLSRRTIHRIISKNK